MIELLQKINDNPANLPALPLTARKIIELSTKENLDITELCAVLENCPSTSTKLLSLANSAANKPPRPITNIKAAVLRLGLNKALAVALNVSLLEVFAQVDNAEGIQRHIWEKSLIMGVCARLISQKANHPEPEEAFTAGLLSHIGVITALNFIGAKYLDLIVESMCLEKSLRELEVAQLGVDHAQIGAITLEKWGIPSVIYEAVRHHESSAATVVPTTIDDQTSLIFTILPFAEKVASLFLSKNPLLIEEIVRLARDFRLSPPEVEVFLSEVQSEVNTAAILMGFSTIIETSYDDIYRSAIGRLGFLNKRFLQLSSEVESLEQRLREQERLASFGLVAGMIIHDVNNLLAVVAGYVDLACMETPSPSPTLLAEYAATIQKSIASAKQLTQRASEYTRTNMPVEVDLNSIVLSLRSTLLPLIGDKRKLSTSLSNNLGAILIDPIQAEQLAMNLMINARDAITDQGEITVETSNVSLAEKACVAGQEIGAGNYVVLTVKDTGCGMRKEVQKHIFEPFFTTKGTKGTGLGLSTVQSIAKQTGGTICCVSQEGVGTMFKIFFPKIPAT